MYILLGKTVVCKIIHIYLILNYVLKIRYMGSVWINKGQSSFLCSHRKYFGIYSLLSCWRHEETCGMHSNQAADFNSESYTSHPLTTSNPYFLNFNQEGREHRSKPLRKGIYSHRQVRSYYEVCIASSSLDQRPKSVGR